MTYARLAIRRHMQHFAEKLGPCKRILEVGIAGDDPPGANRKFFKALESYETADCDAALKPDHCFDVADWPRLPQTLLRAFDLVICSQVLEHIWDPRCAFMGLWGLTAYGGFCIVDVPLLYPPHDELGCPDYWRLMPASYRRLAEGANFVVEELMTDPQMQVMTGLLKKRQAA
jgi:SAM-dependent methyltransferase